MAVNDLVLIINSTDKWRSFISKEKPKNQQAQHLKVSQKRKQEENLLCYLQTTPPNQFLIAGSCQGPTPREVYHHLSQQAPRTCTPLLIHRPNQTGCLLPSSILSKHSIQYSPSTASSRPLSRYRPTLELRPPNCKESTGDLEAGRVPLIGPSYLTHLPFALLRPPLPAYLSLSFAVGNRLG